MDGQQILIIIRRIIDLLIDLPIRINDFMSKVFNLGLDLTLFKIGDFEVKLGVSWIFDVIGVKAPVFSLWQALGTSFIVVMTLALLKKLVPVI